MSEEIKIRKSDIERAVETLFSMLEKQESGPERTQHIRGQIAGLRTALRLGGFELALAPEVRPIPVAQRSIPGDNTGVSLYGHVG